MLLLCYSTATAYSGGSRGGARGALAIFGLIPLYKILPHSRTIRVMNFIFTTKQVEVFVHMIFKFALLSQTDWENIA